MNKVFEFEALGHKYKARYSEMYGYYWVTNESGHTFKVDEESFKKYMVGTEEENEHNN